MPKQNNKKDNDEKSSAPNDSFKETINEINEKILEKQQKGKEKVRQDAEKDEDSDTINFGDLLLNGIIECSTSMGKYPNIVEYVNNIVKLGHINKEEMSSLLSLITMMTTHMVYNSILLYDDLLKDEIQKQLDHVGNHINLSKSDIEALKAVVKIHSKDLSQIKESLQIDKFRKENGI